MGCASHIRSVDLNDLISRLQATIAGYQALREHLGRVGNEIGTTLGKYGHENWENMGMKIGTTLGKYGEVEI